MTDCLLDVCAAVHQLGPNSDFPSGARFAHERSRYDKWLPFVGVWTFVCISPVQCVFAVGIYTMHGAKKTALIVMIVYGLYFLAEPGFTVVCVWFTCQPRFSPFFFCKCNSSSSNARLHLTHSDLQAQLMEVHLKGR